MAQIVPPSDQLTTLYKASQGFANSNSVYEVEQEAIVSRPNILADRIFLNNVPDEAPTVLALDTTWSITGSSAARYTSPLFWIVNYRQVPLTSFAGNPDETFYFGSAMNGTSVPPGTNLLINMLLPLMVTDASSAYDILVTDTTGATVIPPSNYILDRYAGIITIYPGNSVSSAAPPCISFWRYEGPTLRDANIEADSSGNVVFAGNLTVEGVFSTATFSAANFAASTFNVSGATNIGGLTTITDSLEVTNAISSDTLDTNIVSAFDHIDVGNGLSTMLGGLLMYGDLSANSASIVGAIRGNSLSIAGNVTMGGNLRVIGDISANGGIAVGGTGVATNTISAGSGTISGTLNTNAIIASGPIQANGGFTTSSGTLNTNAITAGGLVTANAGLSVTGNSIVDAITADGLITANAGINVAGGTLTTGAITASGLILANGGFSTSSGPLNTSAITASGLITANAGLTIAGGSLSFPGGSLSVSSLNVTGNTTLNGPLTNSQYNILYNRVAQRNSSPGSGSMGTYDANAFGLLAGSPYGADPKYWPLWAVDFNQVIQANNPGSFLGIGDGGDPFTMIKIIGPGLFSISFCSGINPTTTINTLGLFQITGTGPGVFVPIAYGNSTITTLIYVPPATMYIYGFIACFGSGLYVNATLSIVRLM